MNNHLANLELPDFDAFDRSAKQLADNFPFFASNSFLNFIDNNFAQQGFLDNTFKPWQPLKKPRRVTKQPTKQAILIATGKLRRSFRIVNVGTDGFTVGTYIPYAKIHNEGGIEEGTASVKAHARRIKSKSSKSINVQQVKAHTRKFRIVMPQRQFIGNSYRFSSHMSMQYFKALQQLGGRFIISKRNPS